MTIDEIIERAYMVEFDGSLWRIGKDRYLGGVELCRPTVTGIQTIHVAPEKLVEHGKFFELKEMDINE